MEETCGSGHKCPSHAASKDLGEKDFRIGSVVLFEHYKLCLVPSVSAVGDATQSRNAPCRAEGFRARDPAFIKAH